jgi:tRNA (guanine6-N2)-methyltransferase
MLGGINSQNVILDPMCGSGTILVEAATFRPAKLIGGDIEPEAVKITIENMETFDPKLHIDIRQWDAQKLPLDNKSVDKIICNLPFGKQIEVSDIKQFYKNIIAEFDRVLRPGKMVLLTNQVQELTNAVNMHNSLKLYKTLETNLNGEVANLLVIDKA